MLFRQSLVALGRRVAGYGRHDLASPDVGPPPDTVGVPEGVEPLDATAASALGGHGGRRRRGRRDFQRRAGGRRVCSCAVGPLLGQQAGLTAPNASGSFGVFGGHRGRHRGGQRHFRGVVGRRTCSCAVGLLEFAGPLKCLERRSVRRLWCLGGGERRHRGRGFARRGQQEQGCERRSATTAPRIRRRLRLRP